MVNINTVWTESIQLLALESLAGGAAKAIQVTELATQDIVGITLLYNEHASASAGLRVKTYGRNPLTGIGTDGVAYGDGIQFDIDELGTRLETVVDSDSSSGQKVLNITATTNSRIGQQIIIAAGDATLEEIGIIESIQAGVSITLVDDLANTHTSAAGNSVEEYLSRYVPLYGMSDAMIMLENLDGTNACEIAVFAATRDWTSV